MNSPFSESYIGRLREKIGNQLLIMPAFRTIVENADGQILLCLRNDFKKWGVPAGYPETDESMLECIKREVKEESGLVLLSCDTYGFASNPAVETCTYPNGDRVHSFCLLTYSRDFTGTPAVSDHEMSDVRFFNYDALPENILENELLCIRAFQAFKKSGQFQWL